MTAMPSVTSRIPGAGNDRVADGPADAWPATADQRPDRRFDELVHGPGGEVRQPARPATPRRRTATRRGPVATPVQRCGERPVLRATGVPAPRLASPVVRTAVRHDRRRGTVGAASSTGSQRSATTAPTPWRLTDRGLAVVMAVGLVLVVASVVAVVTTAITVTSEDYRPATGVQQHA